MQYNQQPLRIQRTFVLQNEINSKTKVIPFEVFTFTEEIDLFPLFSYALQDLKNLSIKIYDFRTNRYVDIESLGIRYHIPMYIFDSGNHIVLIKYTQTNSETLSLNSYGSSIFQDNKSETPSKKTERSKERVILQVIQIVKKWRKLCDSKKGNCLTLAEAAEVIGLPKKSLDDYYYQLRMGEKYGFDFHGHIMQRIGVLRSFLKKYKTHRKNDKNEKLPNILNIADEIDGYQNLIKQSRIVRRKIPQQQIEEQKFSNQLQDGLKKKSLQKQFYNEFNYNQGPQLDPFLILGKYSNDNRMMQQEPNNCDFQMFF